MSADCTVSWSLHLLPEKKRRSLPSACLFFYLIKWCSSDFTPRHIESNWIEVIEICGPLEATEVGTLKTVWQRIMFVIETVSMTTCNSQSGRWNNKMVSDAVAFNPLKDRCPSIFHSTHKISRLDGGANSIAASGTDQINDLRYKLLFGRLPLFL